MTDVGSERTTVDDQRDADLNGRVVSLWLIVGAALIATSVVALGWQLTAELWVGSAAILALIAVTERIWRGPLNALSRVTRLN